MESLCGILIVESLLCHHRCEILRCGIVVMEYLLWMFCCGVFAVDALFVVFKNKSLLWNRCS